MKKIGIMTFHRSHNCGSLLQAYALQKVLTKKMNMESELIEFSNEAQKELYSLFWKNNTLKKIVKNALYLANFNLVKTHRQDYLDFIENELTLSKGKYQTSAELEGVEKDYSMLIAGSDQVWNVCCYDADDAYYLNFAKDIKKIAYAASLGAMNLFKYAKNVETYKKYLEDFKWISIREGNGQKWISELTERDIEIALDPTLLLDKEEWDEIIDERLIEGDYILYYSFGYPDYNNEVVKAVSDKYKMPVMMLDGKSWIIKSLGRYGFKITENSGPKVLLNLIKHAKLILTTSFHGTAFSVKFEKQFCYLYSDLHNKDDDRCSYLMKQLNVESQNVHINDLLKMDLLAPIDYSNITKDLKPLQEKSLEFLSKAIRD